MNRNLDILRAVAVTLVVLCHLLRVKGFAGDRIGVLGVLLFFVHTSLVLMMSLDRQRGTYWQFIVRRVFRIYPLSTLVVLFYFFTGLPDPISPGFHLSGRGLFGNLFLVQNFVGTSSMPTVLWSLPFEMQMYLLLPLLFVFCTSLRKCFIAWIIAVALTLIQRFTIGPRPEIFAFMPCFIPGVMAFVLFKSKPIFSSALWIPFLVILGSAFTFANFPGANWPLCLILGLSLPFFREMKSNWLTTAAEYVARYSYGIYLTHLIAMYFGFVLLSGHSLAVQWVVFLLLFAAIPVLLYHTIEEPLVKMGKALSSPPMRSMAVSTGLRP